MGEVEDLKEELKVETENNINLGLKFTRIKNIVETWRAMEDYEPTVEQLNKMLERIETIIES